jgi:D-alanyl-D-alanine carboxypeptidase
MKLPVLAVVVVLVAGACGSSVAPPGSAGAQPSALPPVSLAPTPGTPTAEPTQEAFELLGSLPHEKLGAGTASALQGVLEGAVSHGAPDAIAAVITPEGTWSGAAGIGGPDGRMATARDEFAIASVTKLFTATLILRLAEQGKVELDAQLSSYLGDLKVDANEATVRQALEMMAGLADDEQPAAADAIHVDASHVWTPEELVARYLPPVAAPGTRYMYSSPGYSLLGFAAENASGMSLPAAMRAEILDPVGATRVLAQGPDAATPRPWALPIDRHLGTWRPEDMGVGGAISCISSATYGPGAGSMASDAPSLAAWLWHLFAGDILADSSLEVMLAGPQQHWAYGLESAPYPYIEANAIGGSGNKTGYGSQWTYFPEHRAIVVIFVNDPDFIVESTVQRLLEAASAP